MKHLWISGLLFLSALGPGPGAQDYEQRIPAELKAPAVRDERLDRAAQAYAQDLARRGVLSHRDSENQGIKDRLSFLPPGTLGEILGAGKDSREVVAAWMKSPSHRRVLKEEAWDLWGLGLAPYKNTQVVVAVFWRKNP